MSWSRDFITCRGSLVCRAVKLWAKAVAGCNTQAIAVVARPPAGRTRPVASPSPHRRISGFTLAELLVTVGVLALLVLLFTQLLNSTASITTLGHKQIDADSQGPTAP